MEQTAVYGPVDPNSEITPSSMLEIKHDGQINLCFSWASKLASFFCLFTAAAVAGENPLDG